MDYSDILDEVIRLPIEKRLALNEAISRTLGEESANPVDIAPNLTPDQIRKLPEMVNLLIELPADVFNNLKNKASDLGKSPQELVQDLVISQLVEPQAEILSERERGRRALMAGGLLTELGPEIKKRQIKILFH